MLDLKLFFLTCLVIVMAPGPTSVIIIQTSIDLGMKHALAILAGAVTASITYCLLTGFGLAAIITTSPFIFNTIKFLGCFYILYLGVAGIYHGVTILKSPHTNDLEQHLDKSTAQYQLYFKGFITGILNAALILLILSVFPQFIVNNDNMLYEWLALSVVFISTQLLWYIALIFLLVRLRKYMLNPVIQSSIKIVTSCLLIFLAIKIFIS